MYVVVSSWIMFKFFSRRIWSSNLGAPLQTDDLVDTPHHLCNSLEFCKTHPAFVGDIINTTNTFCVFTVDTSGLEMVFVADFLEVRHLRNLGDLDMYTSPHGCTQVARTESKITHVVLLGKGQLLLHRLNSLDQPLVYFSQVASLLHGDQPKMIFLIYPAQEGLVIVEVDTSAGGPIIVTTGGLQESVRIVEEEMISSQLPLGFWGHSSKRIVLTSQFTLKGLKSLYRHFLHVDTVLLVDDRGEAIASVAPANTDTGGDNEVTVGVKITEAQVVHVTEAWLGVSDFIDLMVVHDDGIKDFSKGSVCIRVTGIDTNTAVRVLTT